MNSRKIVNNSKSKARGVIGVDEVGRGSLAGPVTVCAVYLENPKVVKKKVFDNIIRDSKKLTKLRRNKIYQTIRKKRYINKKIIYTISSRSAKHIDKNGINESIKQCLSSCILKLQKKGISVYKIKTNLDAGLIIPINYLIQTSFVKGDENFTEIALASIIAKETRDSYMKRLSLRYFEYKWDKNVGYGTLDHKIAIKRYGSTKYHRISYLKGFKLLEKLE